MGLRNCTRRSGGFFICASCNNQREMHDAFLDWLLFLAQNIPNLHWWLVILLNWPSNRLYVDAPLCKRHRRSKRLEVKVGSLLHVVSETSEERH